MDMPIKFKVKVGTVGNSTKITLPIEIKEYLNVTDGDIIEMYEENGRIILEKQKAITSTS